MTPTPEMHVFILALSDFLLARGHMISEDRATYNREYVPAGRAEARAYEYKRACERLIEEVMKIRSEAHA